MKNMGNGPQGQDFLSRFLDFFCTPTWLKVIVGLIAGGALIFVSLTLEGAPSSPGPDYSGGLKLGLLLAGIIFTAIGGIGCISLLKWPFDDTPQELNGGAEVPDSASG